MRFKSKRYTRYDRDRRAMIRYQLSKGMDPAAVEFDIGTIQMKLHEEQQKKWREERKNKPIPNCAWCGGDPESCRCRPKGMERQGGGISW